MQTILKLSKLLGVELSLRAVDWCKVEQDIGVTLPGDYKVFVERFPSGKVLDFIRVLAPGGHAKHVDLIQKGAVLRDVLREIKEMGEEDCPYPVFPEATGVLPWGVSDNGDFLLWRTQTPEWSMVIGASRESTWVEYPVSMTEFLLAIVQGDILCPVFPDDLLEGGAGFKAYP